MRLQGFLESRRLSKRGSLLELEGGVAAVTLPTDCEL